jgi:hypothetical protein
MDLRHQARDHPQLQLKPLMMVLAEALVLLEEEVEEKLNLIQIMLLSLLPVSGEDEVHQ